MIYKSVDDFVEEYGWDTENEDGISPPDYGFCLISLHAHPLGPHHIDYINEAHYLGRVVVLLNGDSYCLRKYGFVFMPETDRAKLVHGIKWVEHVIIHNSEADSIAEVILKIRPQVFYNAGDRSREADCNVNELEACRAVGTTIAFGTKGKTGSSSDYLGKFKDRIARSVSFNRVNGDSYYWNPDKQSWIYGGNRLILKGEAGLVVEEIYQKDAASAVEVRERDYKKNRKVSDI